MIANGPNPSYCRNCQYECRNCSRTVTTNEIERIREKAKVLVEALEYIIEHQEYVSETMAELSTTRRIAKEALAQWEKEK